MARRAAPEHVARLREIEDNEMTAVADASTAVEAALARRADRLAVLDAAVAAAQQTQAQAIAHMVGAIGVEQAARLLESSVAALRRRLSATPGDTSRHAESDTARQAREPRNAA